MGGADYLRMMASQFSELFPAPAVDWVALRKNAPGLAVSALLHGIALLLILFFIRNPAQVTRTVGNVMPVDLVRLGPQTESPPAPKRSLVPQQASPPRGESSSLAPAGTSQDQKKPLPEDAFDAKLHALSQLRQPDAKLQPLENTGSDADTASNASGGNASYSLKDFVRAQILRHWNLDYSILGERHFAIPLRVEMTSLGVIDKVEIVDTAAYKTDAIYHEVALSAKNAAILSSPIPLPPGNYAAVSIFVLTLDPRDTNK